MTDKRHHAVLKTRSRILQAIRHFFVEHDFIEVETPVRIPSPAQELHIDAEPSGTCYLRTSPELHMKRLLCDGAERIFQMGPCFRRGERGRLHNPEYTMLEWYRTGADYIDMLVDAKAMLASVLESVLGQTSFPYGGIEVEAMPVWDILTVEDAFMEFAGWNPVSGFDADRFDVDLVEKVEPRLSRSRPVILKDYPCERAALAKCRTDDPPVAERWELYIGGMELANAFTELNDAAEQRARFTACAAERARLGQAPYPMDEAFLSALEAGMPPAGGVALGVDRLVMLLTDSQFISDARLFC